MTLNDGLNMMTQLAGDFLSKHVLRPLLEYIGAWDDRLRQNLDARIAECRQLRHRCVCCVCVCVCVRVRVCARVRVCGCVFCVC